MARQALLQATVFPFTIFFSSWGQTSRRFWLQFPALLQEYCPRKEILALKRSHPHFRYKFLQLDRWQREYWTRPPVRRHSNLGFHARSKWIRPEMPAAPQFVRCISPLFRNHQSGSGSFHHNRYEPKFGLPSIRRGHKYHASSLEKDNGLKVWTDLPAFSWKPLGSGVCFCPMIPGQIGKEHLFTIYMAFKILQMSLTFMQTCPLRLLQARAAPSSGSRSKSLMLWARLAYALTLFNLPGIV